MTLTERISALARRIAQEFNSVWAEIDLLKSRQSTTTEAQDLSGYSPLDHTHPIGEVSGLQTALDAKVDDGAVTTSGLTMATNRLLGRTTAATGAIEEIQVGTGLTLAAGILASTATANAPQTDFSAAIQSLSAGNNIAIGTTYSMFEYSNGVDGTVTGLDATGTLHGRLILITVRPGAAGILTLAHESASSTASNRFRLNGVNVALASGDAALLQYVTDGAGTGRWRIVGTSSPGVGGDLRSRLSGVVVYKATEEFELAGLYSATGLSANQNDLAISTTVARFATGSNGGGPYNITGIASASNDGRVLKISVRADMATGVVLVHNSGLSTAGNRFFNRGAVNVTVLPGEARSYIYMGTGSAANNGWYQDG